MQNKYKQMDVQITNWLEEVAFIIKKEMHTEINVETKSDYRDLVSEIDIFVENFLIKKIQANYPGHTIFGEETPTVAEQDRGSNIWFIDPIDGTTNFVKQKNNFCILIGYYEDGVGQMAYLYNVMQGELYRAIKGQGVYCNGERIVIKSEQSLQNGLVTCDVRRLYGSKMMEQLVERAFDIRCVGCGGLDALTVFKGECVAFVNSEGSPWDFAALLIFAQELKLQVKTFEGNDLKLFEKNSYIISTAEIFSEITATK